MTAPHNCCYFIDAFEVAVGFYYFCSGMQSFRQKIYFYHTAWPSANFFCGGDKNFNSHLVGPFFGPLVLITVITSELPDNKKTMKRLFCGETKLKCLYDEMLRS